MEYSEIDWERDFCWETVVVTSDWLPFSSVRLNALPVEIRVAVWSFLNWDEEMEVLHRFPVYIHPSCEMSIRYPKKDNIGWIVKSAGSHSGPPS